MASIYGRSRTMQHRLFFDRDTTENLNQQVMFLLPDFSVSGPVIKNKTFFLVAYQHLIEKKAANAFADAPTPQMMSGDFGWANANPIFDPATDQQVGNGWGARTPFANNMIPVSRFDPSSAKIVNINPWVTPNLYGATTRPSRTATLSTPRTLAYSSTTGRHVLTTTGIRR